MENFGITINQNEINNFCGANLIKLDINIYPNEVDKISNLEDAALNNITFNFGENLNIKKIINSF